jgi:cytochrome c
MLEYGTGWFTGNDDARLVRIEYNGNNRKPAIRMAATKTKGAVPMAVSFNSNGTVDFDRDDIAYEWKITGPDGKVVSTSKEQSTNYTFDQPGAYKATLTVTDEKDEASSSEIEILAGNEPSELSFEITKGNQTYFFPDQSFDYSVNVTDKEDGTLANGISTEQVSVRIDYLPEGFDKIEIAQGHQGADAFAQFATGKKLMEQNDCKACHAIDRKSVGPNYIDVAKKYKDDPKAIDYLAKKVINGGSGVWGETAMAAHPQLPVNEATEIVKYILSVGNDEKVKSLPVRGSYTTVLHKDESDKGVLILRAAYTDKGANGVQPATSEKVVMLKSPNFNASIADKSDGIRKFRIQSLRRDVMIGSRHDAYVAYNNLDMYGINQVTCTVFAPENRWNAAGGSIEVRIDSPTGPLIGTSKSIAVIKGPNPVPVPITVPIKLKPVQGFHDVYFICKNETAPKDQPLLIMDGIHFQAGGIGGNVLTMK